MQIEWSKTAIKDLKALSSDVRNRLMAKVAQFAADPPSLAKNVKALKGSDNFRLRVADYRVIYRIENGTITVMVVLRVRHRSDAYD